MFFKVITTIAVTVAVLAAPMPDPRGGSNGMVIPLTKYPSSFLNFNERTNTDVLKSYIAVHSSKIIRGMNGFERNTGTPHPSAAKRDGSAAGVDLTNHENEWYGIISIGTPAKSFTVQIDTGSVDLFVPASNGDENCRSHPNVWDPMSPQSSAKSLNQDFLLRFMDDAIVRGKQYTDNVTIAGFTADIQTIGAATTYSSEMAASEFAADGILGLAFPSDDQSPLFHTLFKEGKLRQPVFSLMLAASGGELYVGGMNEALYIDNSLAFTPVTVPAFWKLNIDNIKVGDRIVLTDVPAIIDTGSVFIFGDPSRVLALHQAYGGKVFKDGYYTFLCSPFPSVTFTIGGRPFLIPASILNFGPVVTGSSHCFSGIMAPDEDKAFWTIGTMFLQLFYTVFDFGREPRIGFATLAS